MWLPSILLGGICDTFWDVVTFLFGNSLYNLKSVADVMPQLSKRQATK